MSLWGIANDICSSAVIIHNIFSIVLPCWLIAVGAPAASRPLEHRPQYRSIAGVPKSLVYILIFQRHSAAYSVYILTRRWGSQWTCTRMLKQCCQVRIRHHSFENSWSMLVMPNSTTNDTSIYYVQYIWLGGVNIFCFLNQGMGMGESTQPKPSAYRNLP